MTTLRSVSDSTTAVAQVNDNFKAVSAAGLYGYNAFTTTGLFFGYYGGRAFGNTVADSAVLLTASTTNYIVANRATGAVTAATTTTNWNDTNNYLKLFSVVTGSSSITSYVDERQSYVGASLTNPMTTAEDLMKGGASGTPTRLAKGADGQVLAVVSGALAWTTVAGTGDVVGPSSAVADNIALFNGTTGKLLKDGGKRTPLIIPIACGDETTPIAAGTSKVTFRMPCAMTLTAVRGSLTTAQASGASLVTVDVNEAGTSILSTKLTFDNTEKTTTTAATAPVISDPNLADDAEITIDVDLVQSGSVATGLKVYLIGFPA